jgi:cell wall integrity and stress response component
MRHRRRREIEAEFARQSAVSTFIGGGKGSSGTNSFSDPRIDPAVLAQRRMSDGSIADNQDYSRRILKVRTSTLNSVLMLIAV